MQRYVIVPENGKFSIRFVNKEGKAYGRSHGERATEAEAQQFVAALEEANKMFIPLSQTDAAYTTLSTTPGEACANCRWYKRSWGYDGEVFECHIVDNWPEPILATGHSNRWESGTREPIEQAPMPVVIVDEADKAVEAVEVSSDPGILKKAMDTIVSFFKPDNMLDGKFSLGLKQLGDNEWLGIWSNNFEDREEELFYSEAQKSYLDAVHNDILPYPVLQYWHLLQSTHGKASAINQAGHFMWAKGAYTDDILGQSFKAIYQESAKRDYAWKMSHGYWFPREALIDGVYHQFVTDELTTLPPLAAANFGTWFVGGMKEMEVSAEQRKALEEAAPGIGGRVADFLATQGAILREAGTGYKGLPIQALEDKVAREEASKAVGAINDMGALLISMAQAVKTLTDGEKARSDQMATIQQGMQQIQTLLNMTPGRATQDNKAVVSNQEAALQAYMAQQANAGQPLMQQGQASLGQTAPQSPAELQALLSGMNNGEKSVFEVIANGLFPQNNTLPPGQ